MVFINQSKIIFFINIIFIFILIIGLSDSQKANKKVNKIANKNGKTTLANKQINLIGNNKNNNKNNNKKVVKPKPTPKGTNKGKGGGKKKGGNGGTKEKSDGNGIIGRLTRDGTDLKYNGEKIFLLGTSFSWLNYAQDFGSGAYANTKATYEAWLALAAQNGANCVRITLHIDGQWSPKMDSTGQATGADTASLISELGQFLTMAEKNNIFVIIILWNGGDSPKGLKPLINDETALATYLDKVLTPLVSALAQYKALGAYEVVTEIAGSTAQSITDSNPCFDTNKLKNTGANWDGTGFLMKNVLRFINRIASAIHSASPKSLVTLGAWSYIVNCDSFGNSFNYYKDECLIAAGGKANGILDFYQLHSFTWNGMYDTNSPMIITASQYKYDKPCIVGEFSSSCSTQHNSASSFKHVYEGGYAGCLGWQYAIGGYCSDNQTEINSGLIATKDMTGNGKIKIQF